MDRSQLSVVVPIYNEHATLPELTERLRAAIATLGFSRAEVLLVSDGSTDSSEPFIRDLARRDRLFKGVLLTRNFGHQAAISTGLSLATGSVVAILDGDLQDPPEVLRHFVDALAAGADVAYGVRTRRKEALFKRAAYTVFYRALRQASTIDIPLDSGDFCCMRRPVVDAILSLPESCRFVRGLRAWVGFTQVAVPFERGARHAGDPKYTLRRLVGLAYDGFFSFSNVPIRIIQMLGFVASLTALAVALIYAVWWLIEPQRFPQGFATLTISIWFLGGVQLLFLGIVGEYVVRAAEEARHRPVAVVREIIAVDDRSRQTA